MAAIGIDLGTTNSLVAVFEDDRPRLINNALGEFLTPSAVSIDDRGQVLVGQAAKDRLISNPSNSASSFKRFMGSSHATSLGNRKFLPEDLSALVLLSLKADAEAHLGKSINSAVISVPAYFNDPQRKATVTAAKLAGLDVERLVNEPTAAALSYGLAGQQEGKYLVFDLGGGTFDVSILDKFDDIMEIRATTGDTRLGGDDFTAAIENLLARTHRLQLDGMPGAEHAVLRRQCEVLKHRLTAGSEAEYAFGLGSNEIAGKLSRSAFETECAPLVQRLRLPTERALRDASLTPQEFDAVVMVGGATRMPMVRSLVARLFGRLPLATIDPDTTVALGAAVQSGLAQRSGALRDVVMTDVCPYTLGVATIDDADNPESRLSVAPVIERNAIIPISRNLIVSTVQDNQRALAVQVYQGENLRPESNIHLGTLEVKVPRGKRGEQSIDIRFTYDVDGTLQVEVKVLSTEQVFEKFFLGKADASGDDLAHRFKALARLKQHPRDQQENVSLIAYAERLYEESRGEARDEIKRILIRFEKEIADQKLRNSDACRQHFKDELRAFDPQLHGVE